MSHQYLYKIETKINLFYFKEYWASVQSDCVQLPYQSTAACYCYRNPGDQRCQQNAPAPAPIGEEEAKMTIAEEIVLSLFGAFICAFLIGVCCIIAREAAKDNLR